MLPRWYLRRIAVPAGRWLSKKTKLSPSFAWDRTIPDGRLPAHYHGVRHPLHGFVGTPTGLRDFLDGDEDPTISLPEGNLPLGEYRFFCGHIDRKSVLVKCRGCNGLISGERARKAHTEATGCTTKLVKAYRLLLRDHKCVICDAHTNSGDRKWGVPLCGRMCTVKWMFSLERPDALMNALHLVERELMT